MATKKRRLLKVLVFLLLAGSVGAAVYFNLRQEKAEETYPTALVERGAVVDKLAETGRIELVRTVEVKSTIAGEIRDLPIEAGAWVETGELMAVIEPDPNQSLQLYQKRSSVEQGKIDLAEQERNFERQKTLFDSKMIPAKQFEEAEVRLTRARTGLRLAQLELDMLEAKANLQRVQLCRRPSRARRGAHPRPDRRHCHPPRRRGGRGGLLRAFVVFRGDDAL